MHVHHHHALGVLGEDVDPLELRHGVAERRNVALLLRQGLRRRRRQRREILAIRRLGLARRNARIAGRLLVTGTAAAPGRLGTGRWRFENAGRQAHLALRAELTRGLPGRAHHRRDSGRRSDLILRAYIGQRTVQGAVEEVVHHAAVAKAHLVLGRMDVDVHRRRVDFQEQHEGRMPAVEQHVAVGLAHRVGDQLVAHHAPVDVEILQVRLAAREGRQADPAPQAQAATFDLDGQRLLEEGRATDRGHAARAADVVPGLMQAEHGLAVVAQMECHIETGQRQALDHFLQVVELGFFRPQELAPRRRVEEQVTDFHRGADRVRGRLHPRRHVAPLGLHLPGLVGVGGTRCQGQARHRADRRQCLATKAHAEHRLEVFQFANLAGGVARQGQRQIVRSDAAAVVAHLEQLDAALLDFHIDAPRTGVQAVFQQFLGHRSGTLDDLARSDLVGQARAEQMNTGHDTHYWAARDVAGICSF